VKKLGTLRQSKQGDDRNATLFMDRIAEILASVQWPSLSLSDGHKDINNSTSCWNVFFQIKKATTVVLILSSLIICNCTKIPTAPAVLLVQRESGFRERYQ
jgi:hypothetical protein